MKFNKGWIATGTLIIVVAAGATAFFMGGPPRPGRGMRRGARPVIAEEQSSRNSTTITSDQTKPSQDSSSTGDPSALNDPLTYVSTSNSESKSTSNAESAKDSIAVAWNRFRGPNGTGISSDESIPLEWSETKNLQWKTPLPGYGSSSPILTKTHIYLTSYSGYGTQDAGSVQQLRRQILCIDRAKGTIEWSKEIAAVQPEDAYRGNGLPEHGYATNTATTDGQLLYAFLGKSGVYAFDLQGNEKWHVSVGTESGNRGWGSAASLLVYDNLLIVNAAEESQTIYGLDKQTGQQVWSSPAATLELCYSTPSIVRVDNHDELVIAVPGEIWGLDPKTGKLLWFTETQMKGNLSPSVIVDGTTVFAFGGYRSSGSMAVRAGGKGDVTKSNVLWSGRASSYVATPVFHGNRLYWIDDQGFYYCVDAQNGNVYHKSRVPRLESGERIYASPIIIDSKIYLQTRRSGLLVLSTSDKLDILAQNTFASDSSQFNATPAVDQGQLFLRSNEALYCVSAGK